LQRVVPKIRPLNSVEDLPSNISVDEWGEVFKFNQIIDAQLLLKEKEEFRSKQK